MTKTPEEIAKFKQQVLEELSTARPEDVPFLQGVMFGLRYPEMEEKKMDGFSEEK